MYKTLLKFANGVEFIAVMLEGPSAVLYDVSTVLRNIAKNNEEKGDDDENN